MNKRYAILGSICLISLVSGCSKKSESPAPQVEMPQAPPKQPTAQAEGKQPVPAAQPKQRERSLPVSASKRPPNTIKSRPTAPSTSPAGQPKAPAAAKKVKVVGSSRRDVYGGPGADNIIGKAEPGALLRVTSVIATPQGGNWYQCTLESGDMYTSSTPSRDLTQGWLFSTAVIIVE